MFELVAFDTETTGTVAKRDRIIEIGAARFVDGKLKDTFVTFVDPEMPIPAESTRVHNITNSMVKGAPSTELAIENFSDFCGSALLVAHNAPFDVKFLAAEGMRVQAPLPSGLVFDSYAFAKRFLSDLFNHRLENLTRHYGLSQGGFHRANQDAIYCGQVFLKMLSEYKKKYGSLKLSEIINLSGGELKFPHIEARAKQIALFG